jgi:protein-S-isoprenylcysteine O-methyltransferase Ste14
MDNGNVSEAKPRLPASSTHFGLNLVGLAAMLGALAFLRQHPFGIQDNVLVLLGAMAVPIIVLDVLVLKVHRRPSTGLDWDKPWTPDYGRVGTKLLGLAVTIGTVALAYWAFSEYHGSFYDPFYAGLRRLWLPMVTATPLYFTIVDGAMLEPYDAYWQLGRVFLGKREDAKGPAVANLFRSWLVKAFFLPLMLVWMHGESRTLIRFDFSTVAWNNLRLYDFLYALIFGVDLVLATVGYIMSFRAIDTHIRSAEPTMTGWVVALFCYQPFYGLMENQYVRYSSDFGFGAWLAPYPVIRGIWAATIVILISIYTLGTVAFGVRFSNLTHRGILTNGPYRFTKHPAYVAKNLSWWLVSIPFVPHTGIFDAIRHSMLLGCINTMYFLRARTEERHLSKDPTYVAYALWMNDHGALRFLARLIPALKYKAPPDYAAAATQAGDVAPSSASLSEPGAESGTRVVTGAP